MTYYPNGNTNYVSFPGLGIDEFAVDPVAFTLFGREVRWYGIIITFGIIAAFMYVWYRTAYKKKMLTDDLLDCALIIVPVSIICARLYYVLFDRNGTYNDFIDVIAIWDGGLAIYGAIIGGAITTFIIFYIKGIRFFKLCDAVGPAVMLGQLIGRWGNFTNGEAFGAETDSLFRMTLSHIPGQVQTTVHPTFLYESLWNLLGFILINVFYKKKRFDGQWVLAYIAWYGLGRGFIEMLRQDSLYVGNTDIRVSSLLGFILFIFATALIIFFMIRPSILGKEEEFYLPTSKSYAKVVKTDEKPANEVSQSTQTEASDNIQLKGD